MLQHFYIYLIEKIKGPQSVWISAEKETARIKLSALSFS